MLVFFLKKKRFFAFCSFFFYQTSKKKMADCLCERVHRAAQYDDIETIELLCQTNDLTNQLNDRDENILFTAIRFAREKVVAFLLQNLPNLKQGLNTSSKTPLHVAVKTQNKKIVNQLLQNCPDLVSARDYRDRTPFQYAIKLGSLEIVQLIVQYCPRVVEQVTQTNCSVLHLAIYTRRVPVLAYLLDLCPSRLALLRTTCHVEQTALECAAYIGLYDAVELLLHHNPDTIDVVNSEKMTPFLLAVVQAHIRITEYLLIKFPYVIQQTNREGRNALFLARDVATATLLLSKEPNLINAKDIMGRNVLHHAIWHEKTQLVDFFLNAKPEFLQQKDTNNDTPLQLASVYGFCDLIARLLVFKPDVVDLDKFGNTTLHMALESKNSSVIKDVLKYSLTDLQRPNVQGETPLQLAMLSRDPIVVNLFYPYLTFDIASHCYDKCLCCSKIDLHRRCLDVHRHALKNNLLDDLIDICWMYVWTFDSTQSQQTSKKRHREE